MKSNAVKIILEKDFKSRFISRVHSMDNTNKNTMYSSSFNSRRNYLNFINTYFGDYYDKTIKSLIEEILLELELSAPGTSDLFLDILTKYYKDNINVIHYFNQNFDKDVLRLEKKDLSLLSQNIENDQSNNIIENIIEIMEYDDQLFIDDSVRDITLIKKTDQLFYNVKFDQDFLIPFSGKWERDEFKFIVIDGFIDSLGEIHHLLQRASEDKEPYVLFCKGMRDEVKNTILYNLQRKTIDVMPITLEINEENVNVLNDIAACLDSDVVSSTKGDVISVEVSAKTGDGLDALLENIFLVSEISENIVLPFESLNSKFTVEPSFKSSPNHDNKK